MIETPSMIHPMIKTPMMTNDGPNPEWEVDIDFLKLFCLKTYTFMYITSHHFHLS